jgi:hypothetical protein
VSWGSETDKSVLAGKRNLVDQLLQLIPPTDMMDIRTFFAHLRVPRGAFASGAAYERAIHARLRSCTYKNEPVRVSDPAGANKTAQDLTVLNNGLTLEAKTRKATEGGGCTLTLQEGVLCPPVQSVLRQYYPTDLRLWEGRIPSCLTGDRSLATWTAEKEHFKGVYLPVPSTAVAEYYRAKGTMYMQIEGKGLYHTGVDTMGWGVPLFELPCRIRIRLKQHSGDPVPQDVQACFNFKTATLAPSPYDFMESARLPPDFALAAE